MRNMRKHAQLCASILQLNAQEDQKTSEILQATSGPEPTDPTPGSRWTASRFIIG